MGNIKYSKIASSNGVIKFNKNLEYIREFNNFEYIKFYNGTGDFKIYINNSTDYILYKVGTDLVLEDFAINSIKIVAEQEDRTIMYYACK